MAVPSWSDYHTFRAVPFRSFSLFIQPTSTGIAKRKAMAEKLLARAKSNGYERGAHREATVRIFNINTNKLIKSRFQVRDGEAVADGPLAIANVAGTGTKIELSFVNPAGSRTGKLLPTRRALAEIDGFRVYSSKHSGLVSAALPGEAEAHPVQNGKPTKERHDCVRPRGRAQNSGVTTGAILNAVRRE